MNAVEVKEIKKTYLSGKETITALHGISFDVKEGELFGLIGPDGAGKTSLFRILTTVLLPNGGSATVNGFDVVKDYKKIRNCVGYMPGKFSLYQDLTVEENLSFFATLFNTTIEENYELIKDIYVQIEPFKTRRAGKLSGGMKQKLALSCALIHKPVVLFLDEPTTGVDPVSRKEFWEMLKRLKRQGITIVVSTPYMDEATLCDRIALIQHGNILSIDKPDKITKSFPHQLYAIKSAEIYQLLKDVNAYENSLSCYAFGEYLHLVFKNEQEQSKADLLQLLKMKNHLDIELKPIDATIEDCFIGLLKSVESPGHSKWPGDCPQLERINMSKEIVIQANLLTKQFGDFIATNNITFEVYKGEIFGFLGANGAGKTTAMRILCGLSSPSSGKATVAGFDVTTQPEEIKKNIGYMSQKFSLYEDLTVTENIQFFGGIYGLSNKQLKEKSEELINRLGLHSAKDQLVGSLPLGWKQKLSFSIAILHEPKVVFLDEPTGGVDPVTRRQFWDLIYQAAESGITVFVTTHYMDEAEYCNRISIMVDGRIEALDSPTGLRRQFNASSMDDVFYQLARKAKRSDN